jgi:hypothetical protein
MTVIFDGVTLRNVQEFDRSPEIQSTVVILASGQKAIQSISQTGFVREYSCVTTDFTDVTNLLAKIGSSGTLVEDGVSYTNCTLTRWIKLVSFGINYEYTVRIERDTS